MSSYSQLGAVLCAMQDPGFNCQLCLAQSRWRGNLPLVSRVSTTDQLQQKPEMISECLPFTLILVIIFSEVGTNNMANFSDLFISFERSKLKLTFLLIEY